jgi:hypothetical protein
MILGFHSIYVQKRFETFTHSIYFPIKGIFVVKVSVFDIWNSLLSGFSVIEKFYVS